MLECTVDLLNTLLFAVILLMILSIVGSVVAALRAVSRRAATSTRTCKLNAIRQSDARSGIG
jgi:hypothetical protein